MLLSASYVILWLAQHAWDYAVEVLNSAFLDIRNVV